MGGCDVVTFINFMIENQREITNNLFRHIELVGISVFVGIIISIPLGILLSRHKKLAGVVLAITGTIQTIPGLVMLGFALIFLGIGMLPALVVLSLYAILPILPRSTKSTARPFRPSRPPAAVWR